MRKRDVAKKVAKKVVNYEERQNLKAAQLYRDSEFPNESVAYVLSKIKDAEK